MTEREKLQRTAERYSDTMGLTRDGAIRRLRVLCDMVCTYLQEAPPEKKS